MIVHFLDAHPLHAREVRSVVPALAFEVEALPSGYSASSPSPAERARDKIVAVGASPGVACFAEANDLLTMDGKSLRLELDTGNDNRFCKWWRETPVRLVHCTAMRRAGNDDITVIESFCDGVVADKPLGPQDLGWERLFVPAGAATTLAELTRTGQSLAFRADAWKRVSDYLRS